MSWATEVLPEVYDSVMPSAYSDIVRMPICRVTTVRVSGTVDAYEYAIRVEEGCVSVTANGTVVPGAITGELSIADGSPITDQLARQKLRTPNLTSETAIANVQIKRIALSTAESKRLLRALKDASIAVVPPTDIALDRPTYEFASATGVTRRIVEITAADRRRGEKRVIAMVRSVAAAHGFDDKGLRYDSSFWN